jgi:GH35 family endo-1,4-beta-xylanase
MVKCRSTRSMLSMVLCAAIILACECLFVHRLVSQGLAAGQAKFLGCVHSGNTPAANWSTYFNQVTPENAGKWGNVEAARNIYNWTGLDAAYNFAKSKGLPFKMHTLVWGQQSPAWITALSQADQAAEVEEWMRLVAERYPDIDLVDVVNECLAGHAPAPYANALGGAGTTGWDWVIKSFQMARKYFPNAKLLINDYNVINTTSTTNSYLAVINLLKDRNLIDGIGEQAHFYETADTNVLKTNLAALAATGLPIYISEFDVNLADDAQQNNRFQALFNIFWRNPMVKGITLWGYVQGAVWRTDSYLVRSNGTERPALQWLRTFLSAGNYHTHQSGNWNDVNSWEQFNGTGWSYPAPTIPVITDNVVAIASGHTVTVTANDSAGQVSVSSGGKVVINPGVVFKIKNKAGDDLTVNGTVQNFGTLALEDSATIRFAMGGLYQHSRDGGAIPSALWAQGSTILLDSLKSSAPSNGNQSFGNVVWNCPAQTGNISLGWNGNTIGGSISIRSTGTGRWQMCAPAAGASATVAIGGDVIQSGGQFTATGTGNGNTAITINHTGNITVTGGNFSISRGSQGGTGTTIWNFGGSAFSMSDAAAQNSNSAGAKFIFMRAGLQSLALGGNTTLSALPIEVASGSTLSMGTSGIRGSGIFTLDAGATLEIAHAGGIDSALQMTGAKVLSKAAGYSFNGLAAQATGNLLPDTVSTLSVNNTEGVSLTSPVVVTASLDMKKGAFSPGGKGVSYGANSSLRYSGSLEQTTADFEFPAVNGPRVVTIANSSTSGVNLHASRAVRQVILAAGKLRLDASTLTVDSVTNAASSRFVITNGTGTLRQTSVGSQQKLFPIGITDGYAPVWVTNSGIADTISARTEPDASAAPFGGRVNAKWTLAESSAGGGSYTLQFGWTVLLEDEMFPVNRAANARIYRVSDTTEAGSGSYASVLTAPLYSLARGGVTSLGSYIVGRFKIMTGVSHESMTTPKEFSLGQNYPNPFNPSTTIRFTLPKTVFVSLKVYDVAGREAATLLSGETPAGSYAMEWNALNVPSGTYFYRLQAGTFVATRKLMLVR